MSDFGPRRSMPEIALLLRPYTDIQTGELRSGGDLGIGMCLCRHVVESHDGIFSIETGDEITGNNLVSAEIPFKIDRIRQFEGKDLSPLLSSLFKRGTYHSRELSKTNLLQLEDETGGEGEEGEWKKKDSSGDLGSNSVHTILPKMMIVDDSLSNRKMMKRLFVRLGCDVILAEDGQEAVDIMQEDTDGSGDTSFSLVLMDKDMPIMDGHEATKLIRQMGVQVPIIAVTGNGLEAQRIGFMNAGANEVVIKPLRVEVAERIIETYVSGKQTPIASSYQPIKPPGGILKRMSTF